ERINEKKRYFSSQKRKNGISRTNSYNNHKIKKDRRENMALKVAVGAGHGGRGSTPGKRSPDGEYEWIFNSKVVTAFINELKKYSGVEILRLDDADGRRDIPLRDRIDRANRWGADV